MAKHATGTCKTFFFTTPNKPFAPPKRPHHRLHSRSSIPNLARAPLLPERELSNRGAIRQHENDMHCLSRLPCDKLRATYEPFGMNLLCNIVTNRWPPPERARID